MKRLLLITILSLSIQQLEQKRDNGQDVYDQLDKLYSAQCEEIGKEIQKNDIKYSEVWE